MHILVSLVLTELTKLFGVFTFWGLSSFLPVVRRRITKQTSLLQNSFLISLIRTKKAGIWEDSQMAVKTHFLVFHFWTWKASWLFLFIFFFLNPQSRFKKKWRIFFTTDFMGFILLKRHLNSHRNEKAICGNYRGGNGKTGTWDPTEDRLFVMTQNVSMFPFASMSFPLIV